MVPVTVRDDARQLHHGFFIVQEVVGMARFLRPVIQQADVAVTPSRAETCVPNFLIVTLRKGVLLRPSLPFFVTTLSENNNVERNIRA
ncbi:hypothetical protein [Akkermansia sp.]|uniref:hypothetical protein n=1 Tax=Akkermansia sp. TaxID=1872421 RepID=UPI0025C1362D|nr:hypothetical protein [Akkermansia sp.]